MAMSSARFSPGAASWTALGVGFTFVVWGILGGRRAWASVAVPS